MGLVEISSIQNEQLRELATKYDNGDKKIDAEEMKKVVSDELASTLSSTGRAELQTINDQFDESNWFSKWLDDKDKISTDGNDDGKLSFGEGLKNFAKGLIGGIPKAIINHPVMSGVAIAVSTAAMLATGGAIAPVLWGIGAVGVAATGAKSVYDYTKAETDGEAKAALEGMGTTVQSAILLGATYNSTMNVAKNAGVNTEGNILQTMKSSIKVSGRNFKANYTYLTKGVVTQGSNMTTRRIQTSYQGDGKPLNTYKIDLSGESIEANLAKNPGLAYDAEAGQYYVQTSWGAKSYIDPNAPKGYMYVQYGPGDNNAVEGAEFFETYVDAAKFAENGTKAYVDPATLKPGENIAATKQAPGMFKAVPEGTKYVGAETKPGTVDVVQPKSVLRIDGQGRPYQSTVEFMFKKFQNLTPEQISILKSIDPEAAAKYGY